MSDRNKMAVLCVLIVLAFSIWTKGQEKQDESDFPGADIFQESRRENSTSFQKGIDAGQRERFSQIG